MKVRGGESEELDRQGWSRAKATIDRLEAFADGQVGWASMLLTITTPVGEVALRATTVLVLESGAWRVAQWHTSVPCRVRSTGDSHPEGPLRHSHAAADRGAIDPRRLVAFDRVPNWPTRFPVGSVAHQSQPQLTKRRWMRSIGAWLSRPQPSVSALSSREPSGVDPGVATEPAA